MVLDKSHTVFAKRKSTTLKISYCDSRLVTKIEETTKNLKQVGRSLDLNPEPPECESRALPRGHLARLPNFRGVLFGFYSENSNKNNQ